MTQVPDTDTIISDIEFELMQGTGPGGELGIALDAIRREQNRLRSEYLGERGSPDGRELASALFRLNDMLINLLQEALAHLVVLQRQLRHTGASAAPGTPTDPAVPLESLAGFQVTGSGTGRDAPAGIEIDLVIKPSRLPLVGGFVDRLRASLHRLSLYYVRRLAQEQGEVDARQEEEIARLHHIVAVQDRRIAALQDQIDDLQRSHLGSVAPDRMEGET